MTNQYDLQKANTSFFPTKITIHNSMPHQNNLLHKISVGERSYCCSPFWSFFAARLTIHNSVQRRRSEASLLLASPSTIPSNDVVLKFSDKMVAMEARVEGEIWVLKEKELSR